MPSCCVLGGGVTPGTSGQTQRTLSRACSCSTASRSSCTRVSSTAVRNSAPRSSPWPAGGSAGSKPPSGDPVAVPMASAPIPLEPLVATPIEMTVRCSKTAERTSAKLSSTDLSSSKLRSSTLRRSSDSKTTAACAVVPPVRRAVVRSDCRAALDRAPSRGCRHSGHLAGLGAPSEAVQVWSHWLMQTPWKRCLLPHRSSMAPEGSEPKQIAQLAPGGPRSSAGSIQLAVS